MSRRVVFVGTWRDLEAAVAAAKAQGADKDRGRHFEVVLTTVIGGPPFLPSVQDVNRRGDDLRAMYEGTLADNARLRAQVTEAPAPAMQRKAAKQAAVIARLHEQLTELVATVTRLHAELAASQALLAERERTEARRPDLARQLADVRQAWAQAEVELATCKTAIKIATADVEAATRTSFPEPFVDRALTTLRGVK